jgi:hypothetical protein
MSIATKNACERRIPITTTCALKFASSCRSYGTRASSARGKSGVIGENLFEFYAPAAKRMKRVVAVARLLMKRHSPLAMTAATVTVVENPPPATNIVPLSGNHQPNEMAAAKAPLPAGSLKKVSFGVIAKKTDTKTAYPIMPPTGDSAQIVDRLLERLAQLEALEGAIETDKAELKMLATPHYFNVNNGRHEVPSSVACHGSKGDEILVAFPDRYSLLPDESALLPILGEKTGAFFRQSFELKIKGDKLPENHTQDLMNELQELFAKYGAGDAIEVKEGVKPTAEFHAARHLQLTTEQNLALEQVCPIVKMVKTKGRK